MASYVSCRRLNLCTMKGAILEGKYAQSTTVEMVSELQDDYRSR